MDNQITPVHLIQPLYKHLMGWPVTFKDLEHIDDQVYRNLSELVNLDDVGCLYLEFVVTEDKLGELCAYILILQRIHYYYSYYYYYYYYNIYYHTNTTTTTILPLLLLGVTETVDLIPGGGDVTVDSTNLADYLDAQMKYRTLHRIETQLAEMLKGFYDVVPEPLLSVFDFQVGAYIYTLTLPLSLTTLPHTTTTTIYLLLPLPLY